MLFKVKKYLPGSVLYHLLAITIFAQGEISEQPRIFYRNEKSAGMYLNSNGWNISGAYAKRINARKKVLLEVSFAGIKHPKEVKITNSIISNRSFVFGKLNSFFDLSAGYGRQTEMFRKVDRGGISIRRFFSFGPTLGILKPIYYEVYQLSTRTYTTEKFAPDLNVQEIDGKAPFLKGIDEISVVPGAYGRCGFSFEYSRTDITIHALEIGLSINIFPKKIPIMETEHNNFLFFSLFAGYRFGKVVDASGIIDENDLLY